jgi:YVTN family beta-propeller protein
MLITTMRNFTLPSFPFRLVVCFAGSWLVGASQAQPASFAHVGAQSNGEYVVATNQILTPAGKSATALNDRPASLAISPDGLTAAFINETHNGPDQIVLVDLIPGREKQIYTDNFGSSLSGLLYSADGKKLYHSHEYSGNVAVCDVAADGTLTFNSSFSIQTQANTPPFPAGLAQTTDGARLCVVANVYNDLAVIDLATQQILAQIPVGNAPFTVMVVGNYAYVTNEGGRTAVPGDFINYSAGTAIVADPQSGGVTTGTVSAITAQIPGVPDFRSSIIFTTAVYAPATVINGVSRQFRLITSNVRATATVVPTPTTEAMRWPTRRPVLSGKMLSITTKLSAAMASTPISSPWLPV